MAEQPLLFERLPEDERRALHAVARRRRYGRGETIFHEGDPGDSLHVIVKGHVAIRMSTPRGDVATLTVLAPGETFGEHAVLGDARRSASAVAVDPVETLVVQRADLDAIRTRLPQVDQFLIEVLRAQVQRLSAHLLEALFVDAERRVHRRLLLLRAAYDTGTEPVVLPVTQDDVATLAGTTRPTVNRVLQAAAADGLLELARGRITVLDEAGIARRAH